MDKGLVGDEPKPTSKKRRLTQAERTALSDSRMFEAAIKLIGDHGSHQTTLKAIGEQAGYSRSLANYRFGSKDKLFRSLVNHFNQIWVSELASFVQDKTGLAAFMAAIDAVESILTRQPHYMKAMYILWYESIGTDTSAVKEKLAQQHEAYREDTRRWIEEGVAAGEVDRSVDAAQFAVQYCSFIFGTIYQWLVLPQAVDIKRTFGEYRDHVRVLLAPQ